MTRRWIAVPVGLALLVSMSCGGDGAGGTEGSKPRVLAQGLANPWELIWGPDDQLWVTEKSDGEVTLVSPEDGSTTTILAIPDVVATMGAQDGLLGMALHPELLTGEPYVYLAYTYRDDDEQLRTKLVRYTYDPDARTLDEPVELLAGLPAS
ncbi:MAG TPA: PQQ-dependent sugar dehydrogenase, partial [Natronosporangium sp.]|nr:PQQ-dependent sugar dehydrogenase [Natronosporangium sp.]